MNKLISIIVNCHNGEKYLEKCISSILHQNYQNLEVIFFDNSSTDKSKKIVSNFNDDRIKYFYSDTKLSLYNARNKALNETSGELIGFLDVDDWWDKNYLNSRKDAFNNKKYDIFYNNVFMFYENKKKYVKYKNYHLPSGKIHNSLSKDYFIIISGLIVRKEVFSKIGKFNPNFNIIGDFDFVMRASKVFSFHAFNLPLTFYRIHQNNYSKMNSEIFFKEFYQWYKNQKETNDQNFIENKNYYKKKLLSLEINFLLLNKKKSFYLLCKILKHPDFIQKLKFILGFFLPKKIIKIIKK
jgi:glycosyltransferase involved in cell wall biosynthesis